ncbi:uncharacterized protein LOC126995952 isoform X1 [Eriocheir sinensis]|uniref:uncharacterized protein LOC126995952 isoform X1 n=1 Tax=Eriocheir sinensis TaxID=95602 RepID=UPI0021C5CC09|nr:uncharacterized protein LOC126995952 isoform X1 [Eriocheir sinensis]
MTTSKATMEKAEIKPEDNGELPVPCMTQAEFTDKLETHHAFVKAKSSELTHLTETLKAVRERKEPLTQVKNTLQEEINACNKAINAISEEVTHLKQKLRYHSVRQIHDNIERLEYQLRNNNFKPREEQKILDEISMLRRSVRTLTEFEAKQAENKKYRTERTRLIEERNNNYSKIRALYVKEDKIKKEIAAVRGEISINRKSIDQLRQLRPKLEQEWLAQQQKLQAARNKRYEEKKRVRQEQLRDRQEARRRLWEEYEASREPYEEEKNMCRVLINYLQSSLTGGAPTPSTPASTCSQQSWSSCSSLTPATTPSLPPPPFPSANPTEPPGTSSKCDDMVPPESSGAYYCKSKEEESGSTRLSKRGKAKARKEQRLANRTKELPHTPDVLLKFSKLSITPPKNTNEIPAVIVSLQDQLQHYYSLGQSKTDITQTDSCCGTTEARGVNKGCRPKSLPVTSCSQSSAADTLPGNEKNSINEGKENDQPPSTITTTITSPTTPSSTCSVYSALNISIPAINVVSPDISWASSILPSHSPTNSSQEEGKSATETEPMYNGVPPTINGIHPSVRSVTELQMCSDILSSTGNNESFFSVPISYTCNMGEGKTLMEPNNNGDFSYAAITAKVKPLDF